MEDNPDRRTRMEQLRNFQSVLRAGAGLTRSPDVRGQAFDELLKTGEFQKSGLHDVAIAYMENVRRLLSHASMPIQCIDYGRTFQNVFLQVCHEQGVPPATVDTTFGLPSDREAYLKVSNSMLQWLFGEMSRDTLVGTPHIAFYSEGFAMLDHFGFRNEEVQAQIASHCGSLVIEAWTLFESLSEDLWEASLNSHPEGLAALKGKLRLKQVGNLPPLSTGADPQVKLSFDDLQLNRFDIKNKMGTIRKASVSFRSLAGIREAYHRAFFAQSQSIDDILNDEGLEYAAAVRNLLIHKQGVVDREFLDQTAKVADAVRPQKGERFPLSGPICEKLADSCRCCGGWLINAVHAWIVGHQA